MNIVAARSVLPIEDRYDRETPQLRYLPRDMYRWTKKVFKSAK